MKFANTWIPFLIVFFRFLINSNKNTFFNVMERYTYVLFVEHNTELKPGTSILCYKYYRLCRYLNKINPFPVHGCTIDTYNLMSVHDYYV